MLPDTTVPEAASPFVAGAVPVPNGFFDEVLPTLRDTELRVLLVVLRQTAGLRDKEGRSKTRDWLSHGQLVRRGLIVVEDSAGRALLTPEERRRHLGRLFFRPVPRVGDNRVWDIRAGGNLGKSPDPSRPVKAKRTTNKKNK